MRSDLTDSVAEYDIIRGCTFTGNRAGKCRVAIFSPCRSILLCVCVQHQTKVPLVRPTVGTVGTFGEKTHTVDRIGGCLKLNTGEKRNERRKDNGGSNHC